MAADGMPEVDRAAASRAAVAARRARAEVKEAVRAGRRSALDIAETAWRDPNGVEGGMRVRDLLATLKGLGPTRTLTILDRLGIAHVKRLGGLGHRQRAALREWLKQRSAVPGHGRLVVLAGPTAVGKGTVESRDMAPAYLERIAGDVIPSFKWRHSAWIEELEIRTLTSSHLVGVTAEGATVKNAKGEETFVAADMVIVSGPRLANHDLFQEFQWMVDELHGAGDAVIARGMDAAIHEGYRMGVRI